MFFIKRPCVWLQQAHARGIVVPRASSRFARQVQPIPKPGQRRLRRPAHIRPQKIRQRISSANHLV